MVIMKKRKKTNNGRNRTTKSRKNKNAWKKGKLQDDTDRLYVSIKTVDRGLTNIEDSVDTVMR